jgi:hypothetical protein
MSTQRLVHRVWIGTFALLYSVAAVSAQPNFQACANVNTTSDYMNCLRAANPTLAAHIDATPGGADAFFSKLNQISGLPTSTWANTKTPPNPSVVGDIVSRISPEAGQFIASAIQAIQQKLGGKGAPMNSIGQHPATAVAQNNTSAPVDTSIGSRIASLFGHPAEPNNAPAVANMNPAQKVASIRDPSAVAEDPGVSLFRRVEQKYQALTPQMTGSMQGAVLKDWGK